MGSPLSVDRAPPDSRVMVCRLPRSACPTRSGHRLLLRAVPVTTMPLRSLGVIRGEHLRGHPCGAVGRRGAVMREASMGNAGRAVALALGAALVAAGCTVQ